MGAAETLGGACKDSLGSSYGIFADIVVPGAKYGPTFGLQIAVPANVDSGFCVLAAVDLNDQTRFATGEIYDIRSDR